MTEIILDYPILRAERDRLKEINKKLLEACKAARASFREIDALTWAIELVTQLDTAIAAATENL